MIFNNLLLINNNTIQIWFLIISGLILTPFLTHFINLQCKKFNYLDLPNERKSHKFPTPISGGIVFFISISINLFILLNILQLDLNYIIKIYIFSVMFFLLGLIDDIYNPHTIKKILIIIVLFSLILVFFDDLVVNELRFKYIFIKKISLTHFAIPFTLFCIFMFFNAMNYADGKNGISISYTIFIFLYLSTLNKDIEILMYLNVITLLVLLLFNLKNKLFLGNSGINLLSVFISLTIIKSYNFKIYEFFCDEIFLLMLIPGLDAARVTILRVRKKISPLQPDKQHLHHYIERIFSEKITWLICLSLSSLPIILLEIYDKFILSLLFPSMIYALLIFKATQNKAK